MEFKKQIRWLAFLLIPFVILLTLHFLIPLEFVLNLSPLFEQNYNSQTMNIQQKTMRSTATLNQQILKNQILSQVRTLDILMNFITQFQERNDPNIVNSLSLTSAYNLAFAINQGQSSQNTKINQSMWFSTQKQQISQFSQNLKAIYNQYSNMEYYIRSLFSKNSNQMLVGLKTYFASNNQAIVFNYPTFYKQQYGKLLYQSLDSYYYDTITNSAKGSPFAVFYHSLQTDKQFIICKNCQNCKIKAVSCIFIDFILLNQHLYQATIHGRSELQQLMLISNDLPSDTNLNNPNTFLYDLINYSTKPSQISSSSATIQQFLKKYILQLSSHPKIQLYLTQLQDQIKFIMPISLQQDSTSNLYYISIDSYVKLQQKDVGIMYNINNLLIPVIILIIVASIGSAFVLKFLLDSIEKELFQLGKCCNFIVEGDISVQIPDYFGTKDIKDVYQKVKTINKLHRYTTDSYFSGHFASKILKYNQALQFIRKLNYDPGNILQNMGQACTYMQQWDKCISSLKESINLIMNQIQKEFGTLDQMVKMKSNKKIPHGYRQLEIILIRRLFKLNFAFMRCLQLKPINAKQESLDETAVLKTKQWTQEAAKYLILQKKAFYPDFAGYSQCIIASFNQCKMYANMKQGEKARQLLDKAVRILKIYQSQYNNTTSKLKQKGSKNKFFYKKNRLTAHSRAHPAILNMLKQLFCSKILAMGNNSPNKYIQALDLLFEGAKVPIITVGINYMLILQIRRLLIELKIIPTKFETTQIFKQVVPFKTLYEGPITKEIEPQLHKYPTKTTIGLEREYVFVVDCARNGKNYIKSVEYQKERAEYIYQKLIKKTDRVSIIKFNTNEGVKIQCSLIFKEKNQTILKKQLLQCFTDQTHKYGKDIIQQVIGRAIRRVAKLKSEKNIIIFFKNLTHYKQQIGSIRKKKKSRMTSSKNQQDNTQIDANSFANFGEDIISVMQSDNLRNCKVMLHCGKGDTIQQFIDFFNLQDINRRIWQLTNGLNINNNLIYIIEQKHKGDLDRILMLKAQDIADNHVFIL